jgi:hypothetical protein
MPHRSRAAAAVTAPPLLSRRSRRRVAGYGKDRHQIYRWAERYDIDLGAYRAGESQSWRCEDTTSSPDFELTEIHDPRAHPRKVAEYRAPVEGQ